MPSDYWKRRIEAEQRARLSRDTTLSDEMARLYDYHFRELEKEIRAFEQRYADKNGLPIAEVKARVDALDVKAFEEKARRYVEEKDFSPKANAELELYNLKMKMSRLELLQYQLDLEMVALANSEHKLSERFLSEEYTETLKTQSGLLGKSVLSASEIEKAAQAVLNTPFKGVKWSDRIWERQGDLRQIVAHLTEEYLLKGKNPTTMIPKIRKEFDVSAHEAKRLAVTEGARIATEAEKQSYIANGYDEYEFIAEPKACDICKPLDGKFFKVADMLPGENAAPMHPFCRCATAAHFSMSEKEYERLIKKSADSLIGEVEKPKSVEKIPSIGTAFSYGLDSAHKTLQNFADNVKKWYNSHIESQLTADEIKTSSKVLKNIIDNSAYSMRFKSVNLDKLIDSGKFMNQFETGTSGGVVNTKYRKQATNQLFGLSGKRLKKSEFEKYGYFGNKDAYKDFVHNSTSWGGVGQYGDVIVHFAKDKVANKTTFTVNNSLGPAVYQDLVADNPNRPNLVGIDKESLKETVDLFKTSKIKTPEEASEVLGIRYLETQYHGEIGLSDVSSMYFTGNKPNAEQIQSLKGFGVNLYVKEGDHFVKIE
jgi:SPP1 gp7 family putative phage head morphogenesis protein